jgi:hypothetical protein
MMMMPKKLFSKMSYFEDPKNSISNPNPNLAIYNTALVCVTKSHNQLT